MNSVWLKRMIIYEWLPSPFQPTEIAELMVHPVVLLQAPLTQKWIGGQSIKIFAVSIGQAQDINNKHINMILV